MARDRCGPPSLALDEPRAGFAPILLVSIYLTFRGHNAPGADSPGGSSPAGHTCCGSSRWTGAAAASLRVRPVTLFGTGLVVALGTATGPLLVGSPMMTFRRSGPRTEVPLIGTVKFVSSTVFDVGVYLVVVGAVMTTLLHLVGAGRKRAWT